MTPVLSRELAARPAASVDIWQLLDGWAQVVTSHQRVLLSCRQVCMSAAWPSWSGSCCEWLVGELLLSIIYRLAVRMYLLLRAELSSCKYLLRVRS